MLCLVSFLWAGIAYRPIFLCKGENYDLFTLLVIGSFAYVFGFIIVSIGIIALSISITYVTDIISAKLNLGSGLAGALFLGIATSLPEVSSTIALFKIKNHNIAIGNIIGSNLFNFIILALTDIIYVGNGIYDYSDPKAVNLLIMGMIATPLMLIMMKWKKKFTQVVCPLGEVAFYIADSYFMDCVIFWN